MESSPGVNQIVGQFQLRDYLQIFRRRKWWVILTSITMFLASLVVIWRLPNIYRAQTVILVDPQEVPDKYVASTVTSSISDRLSTLQQEVMSPTRLERLIDTLSLYPEMKGRMTDQALVAKMQRSISVDVVAPGSHNMNAFRVTFQDKNPVEVARVANQLASMFIDENLKSREQQSTGTTEFLNNELQRTKEELSQKEQELSDIKSKYVLDIPESKQYHLESLTSLRTQLRASQDKVERAEQQLAYIRTLQATTAPTIDLDVTSEGSSPYQAQIQKLESELSELRSRYGPSYPDARKVKAELDALKAKAAGQQESQPEAVQPAPPARRRNPVIAAETQKLNDTIQAESKIQAQLNEQINFHVGKLERIPIFEQRISGLMRDYDALRAHYANLNDKRLSAEMSSNLENRQKGERFVVLDAAQVPDQPIAPNRLLLTLTALFGALFGGAALAVFREMNDQSVRNQTEATRILGRPLLAIVPQVHDSRRRRLDRIRAVTGLAGITVASLGIGFAISFMAGRFF